MSSDRSDGEELRRGMTVEIEQSHADNDAPIRGDLRTVLEPDSPKGAKVKPNPARRDGSSASSPTSGARARAAAI